MIEALSMISSQVELSSTSGALARRRSRRILSGFEPADERAAGIGMAPMAGYFQAKGVAGLLRMNGVILPCL
jgi:hypothetical protein